MAEKSAYMGKILRILKVSPESEAWVKLDELAKLYEGPMADAIEKMLVDLRQFDAEALIAALQAGRIDQAVAILGIDSASLGPAADVVHDAVVAGGRHEAAMASSAGSFGVVAAAGGLGGGGGGGGGGAAAPPGGGFAPRKVEFRFDSLDPKLISFLQANELEMVREIGTATKEAVRNALVKGMNAGANPRTVARDIRQVIGLTDNQATAVANFRKQLDNFHLRRSAKAWNLGGKVSRAAGGAQTFAVDGNGKPLDQISARRLRDFRYDKTLQAAMDKSRPLTAEQIDKMVEGYARKYRRLRSETIASNESMRAVNAGVLETWNQAARKGLVNDGLLRKSWLIAKDERTCPICRPMPGLNEGPEGYGIPIKDKFISGRGYGVMAAPIHVRCRCGVFVRMIEPQMAAYDPLTNLQGLAKAVRHYPAGSRRGGQFMPLSAGAGGQSAGLNAVGQRLQTKISSDFKGAVSEYSKIGDAGGGKILNTDIARELSPDYLKNRTLSADVHEPASKFIKDLYAQKLTEQPKVGELPEVMFTAGGTGAGKTTAVNKFDLAQKPQIIYDTNMNSLDSAKTKIDQALAAGKQVRIVGVFRDPVEALVNGALPRAMRQEAKYGTGRTVPLSEHLKTHTGFAATLPQLAEHYKNDPRVNIQMIDNSHGPKGAKLSTLDVLTNKTHTNLKRQLSTALEKEYASGNISKSVYEGFRANSKKQ